MAARRIEADRVLLFKPPILAGIGGFVYDSVC